MYHWWKFSSLPVPKKQREVRRNLPKIEGTSPLIQLDCSLALKRNSSWACGNYLRNRYLPAQEVQCCLPCSKGLLISAAANWASRAGCYFPMTHSRLSTVHGRDWGEQANWSCTLLGCMMSGMEGVDQGNDILPKQGLRKYSFPEKRKQSAGERIRVWVTFSFRWRPALRSIIPKLSNKN